ncbi:hypothetical protein [Kitasatospora sp. Root107]|uniref:hypothetical protein n=1 Tax=Kitasatospora sp. Root107 TaxID=1736424 RepID=UPI0012FAF2A0|nr:hypothetical protein [Kitasatospora sp. Root107]
MVEALLLRTYAEADSARALDGRGGDGGRDFEVVQGGRRRIFQLKYYPDGFPSSSYKKRRAAIQASFETAMEHEPFQWTLVVPRNLTPSEQDFIDALAGERRVKVSVMGRAELDGSLAAFPDLDGYFDQNHHHNDAVKTFIQSSVLPATAAELTERVQAFGRLADRADPDWTFDFEQRGGEVIRHLRAKHPRAAEVSPVTIHLRSRWDCAAPDLTEAFQRAIGYGLPETVTLPPEVVESLSITGPQWLAESHENVEVTWAPAPSSLPRTTVDLRFTDDQGRTTACFEGTVEHHGRGQQGQSLIVSLHNLVTLTFTSPSDNSPPTLHLSSKLAGALPSTALLAFAIFEHVHSYRRFELSFQGSVFCSGRTLGPHAPDEASLRARLRALVEDLDIVQRHSGHIFAVPEHTTAQERINLRVARRLIEGRCVVYAGAQTVTLTLNGTDDEVLRGVLSPGPHAMRAQHEDFKMEFAGRDLPIGRVCLFHTQVDVHGYEVALQALAVGRADGSQLQLIPRNGEAFRIYMPDQWLDEQAPLTVTPLQLPGFDEPR